jgi:tetratricopeptide (TPR) repeat protein
VFITDYRGAIDDFTQAIRLHPNDAKAYTNQGFARAALGDQQGVMKTLTKRFGSIPMMPMAITVDV